MASNVSFGTMVSSVLMRANMENSLFITAAEVREYLNYALADLYDLLVKARAQEFYRSTFTINTVNGTATYALPTDFYELTSVDITLGSNIVLTARPYMEAERNRFRWYPGWFYNQPVYYRLQGNSIGFIPVPSGAFTVTLNYYPTFTKFATNGTQDASTFDGVNGWEEYAVWKAAADCIAKEENDPAYALGKVAELRARIEGLAALRDAGNAERVHDVTGDMTPWSGY